jgi:hypothetical protein
VDGPIKAKENEMSKPNTRSLTLRRGRLALAAGALLLAAGCASVSDLLGPRTLSVPLDRIETAVGKQFPFNSRFAEVFDVTASTPKLRLMPEQNRIGTDLDLSVAPRLLSRKFTGKLSMDSGLRFEPSDNSIRLVSPRVNTLDVSGLGSGAEKLINVNKLGQYLIEQMLNDYTVYKFTEEDLKKAGTKWLPGDFKVTSSGLALTLNPEQKK